MTAIERPAPAPRSSALFVCSNDTHVRTFAQLRDELSARGLASRFVTLDSYYGWGAEAAARELGLVTIPLAGSGRAAPGAFYDRWPPAIWRDVVGARRRVARVVTSPDVAVVVAGNDFGLLEKLVLDRARRAARPTVLVQDGRLSAVRPRPATARDAARRVGKRVLSPLLEALGLGYLGASDYGAGGADLVCATGSDAAALLRARAARRTRVAVMGQPRYDELLDLVDAPVPAVDAGTLTMFTTPFATTGLGLEPQAAQETFVAALAEALQRRGHGLRVKPHPREDPGRYAAIVGADHVAVGAPAPWIASSAAVVVGISSVVEEAAIVGRPVLVPGSVIHGDRFDSRLPAPPAYPRFESASALAAAFEAMAADGSLARLVASQRSLVAREVHFERDRTAASRIAQAIADLALGASRPGSRPASPR